MAARRSYGSGSLTARSDRDRPALALVASNAQHGPSPAEWDGQSEIAVAGYIVRYLERHPAPAGSQLAAAWDQWADDLLAAGRSNLEAAERAGRIGGDVDGA